nr:cytochrome P450 CYP82D47-like [Ipomoea batatas]
MQLLLQNLNTPTIIVCIAIAFYPLFHYLAKSSKSRKQKSPPEAGGAWPILGHLHLFRGSKLPHIALGELADKYGPAFTIRMGMQRVLVVSDWKLAKELSTNHDIHISSRPKFRATKHMGYNDTMLVLAPYGPFWRGIRKLISSELLSNRRLEQLKHIRVSEIETSIKDLYKVLISGGAETPMVILTWALSLIMNHPHVLKIAQEELDRVVGKERKVNESDIGHLMYLRAIVKETFRLYPGGPLGVSRIFTKDCTMSDFHVPKDTWLFFNVWKLQRDPQVWSSPLEFKPERFIDCNKEIDVLGRDFELIPFGVGRRICPGITSALQILHLVLANLLHSFELSNISNEAIDMTEMAGLTNLKATPLEIFIAPRLSPNLY